MKYFPYTRPSTIFTPLYKYLPQTFQIKKSKEEITKNGVLILDKGGHSKKPISPQNGFYAALAFGLIKAF